MTGFGYLIKMERLSARKDTDFIAYNADFSSFSLYSSPFYPFSVTEEFTAAFVITALAALFFYKELKMFL